MENPYVSTKIPTQQVQSRIWGGGPPGDDLQVQQCENYVYTHFIIYQGKDQMANLKTNYGTEILLRKLYISAVHISASS